MVFFMDVLVGGYWFRGMVFML